MEDEENELFVQEDEELEQTNETENTEDTTVEENVENVDVEDTETEEKQEEEEHTEEKSEKKTLAEILKENPELQKEYSNSIKQRLNRQKNSLTRQYDEKYRRVNDVLNAGLDTKSIDEATEKLEKFWREQGLDIPSANNNYSDKELQILAKAEADEIIELGYESIVDELETLANKGFDNMTQKEKFIFKNLEEKRSSEANNIELQKIGAKKEILDSQEFKDFSSMFKENTPITKVYEMYTKNMPEPDIEPIGKLNNQKAKEEKTTYTPDEVDRLTAKDYEDPKVMERVRASMLKWK